MSSVLQFIQNQNFQVRQESKYIVLYFTAHWCPPCKQFSPTFVQSMKAANNDVDVFICSRDRDQNQYNDYMKSFEGFNILPFQSEAVSNMMQELGIKGIPSVQVFDKSGKLVTDDGRSVIMKNVNNFSEGVKKEVEQSKFSALDLLSQQSKIKFPNDAKFVGIYFTASWCPPCQSFSPLLLKTHQEIGQSYPNQFQLVVLSCDDDEEAFNSCVAKYQNKDNAHILPFEDPLSQPLAQKFQIQSIPTLVILNAQNGEIITKDGRAHIETHKQDAIKQW